MTVRYSLIFALVISMAVSCRQAQKGSPADLSGAKISSSSAGMGISVSGGDSAMEFTSPVEIAYLFQKLHVPFTSDYLAFTLKPENQLTSSDRALALGIKGADLGYLNIYEKTGSFTDLLNSIRELADSLGVGSFFDFEALQRLSRDNSNIDSLLYMSLHSYTQINNYFRNEGKGELSSLIIAGAWIEAQYFATKTLGKYPDKRLKDRIGEQKNSLDDVVKIISPYCHVDSKIETLCNCLTEIQRKYKDVKVTYTTGSPIKAVRNSGLVVIQTDTSNVSMSDRQLEGIISITDSVRNILIGKN